MTLDRDAHSLARPGHHVARIGPVIHSSELFCRMLLSAENEPGVGNGGGCLLADCPVGGRQTDPVQSGGRGERAGHAWVGRRRTG